MKLQDYIGNTPLVQLQQFPSKSGVNIYAKLEGNNPGGSVKDRAAYSMINHALNTGKIKKGDHLIEATSGNTGIALAMIAGLLGLKITLVMPSNATKERVLTMKAYGAEVVLTPAEKTIEYSRQYALNEAKDRGLTILNQFANQNNPLAHYKGTGPEIWRDTNGGITHFVSAMGTTGTIMGVSKYLKEKDPNISIIGAQPREGDRIPGIRKWSKELVPDIYDPSRVDRLLFVSRAEAAESARQLAAEEGIMAGMSTGGAFHIAQRIATEIESGTIVFIACDRGDRYLSSDLYS